jgi:radical SAM superfamily enzyme YgiQ (UPF0313 family)
MPKVMLIKVPSYSDVISPPLGIGYLASNINNAAEVTLVDGVKVGMTIQKLISIVKDVEPDMIGFSVVSAAEGNAVEYIRTVRHCTPNCVIVAGGPHPSLMPEDFYAAAKGSLDYIIKGDAEHSFKRLVEQCWNAASRDIKCKEINDIPGIYAETSDGVVNLEIPVNQECNLFGMPEWKLMPPASYPKSPQGAFFRRFPVAPLITSRGCSFNCGFCSASMLKGRTVRFRTAELITEEIRLLRDNFGVKEIQIIDDNFAASKEHALSVCETMIAKGQVMPWTCPNGVRVDTLDDAIVDAMKASGCYSISVGLESGSQKCLRRMNKHLDLDKATNTINSIVKKDIEVNGFFVFGFPGETREDIHETIRLSKELPLTRAHFMLFTPLPGNKEFERLYKESNNGFRYDSTFAEVAYLPKGFTSQELKKLHRKAIFEFYLRPEKALKLLPAISSPEKIFYFARRVLHWIR